MINLRQEIKLLKDWAIYLYKLFKYVPKMLEPPEMTVEEIDAWREKYVQPEDRKPNATDEHGKPIKYGFAPDAQKFEHNHGQCFYAIPKPNCCYPTNVSPTKGVNDEHDKDSERRKMQVRKEDRNVKGDNSGDVFNVQSEQETKPDSAE